MDRTVSITSTADAGGNDNGTLHGFVKTNHLGDLLVRVYTSELFISVEKKVLLETKPLSCVYLTLQAKSGKRMHEQ